METNPFAPLPVETPPVSEGQPPWFAIGPVKLMILSVCTFNLYLVYWNYKQWSCYKKARGANIIPLGRAFFQIFFVRALFREIRNTGSPTLSADALGGLYILIQILDRIAARMDVGVFGMVGFLLSLVVVPVQQEINRQIIANDPGANLNSSFKVGDIVIILMGSAFFMLIIIGAVMAENG